MEKHELWPDAWILHHDNALQFMKYFLSGSFMAKKMKLDHQTHLPDMVLYDFSPFPKLKISLKAHRFSGMVSTLGT